MFSCCSVLLKAGLASDGGHKICRKASGHVPPLSGGADVTGEIRAKKKEKLIWRGAQAGDGQWEKERKIGQQRSTNGRRQEAERHGNHNIDRHTPAYMHIITTYTKHTNTYTRFRIALPLPFRYCRWKHSYHSCLSCVYNSIKKTQFLIVVTAIRIAQTQPLEPHPLVTAPTLLCSVTPSTFCVNQQPPLSLPRSSKSHPS